MTIADEHGVPLTLVELAVAAKAEAEREERRGRGDAWDEIWCVFDEDSHPNLDAAIAKADANGIRVAVSNPCIELWFVLHFEDQTAYIERRQAQSRARDLLGCEKGLSEAALETLSDRYEDARTRAIALDEKHAGDGSPPRSNPSSELWKLVDRIRGARCSSVRAMPRGARGKAPREKAKVEEQEGPRSAENCSQTYRGHSSA